jgi:hypothetical protein
MTWFNIFFRLLYISYLDCEKTLRDIAFITMGVFLGYFSILFGVGYLPPEYDYHSYVLVSITLINVGIVTTLAFQYIVSIVFCYSVIKVAYLYDNKSWGYIKSLKNLNKKIEHAFVYTFKSIMDQLSKDEKDKEYLKKAHDDMIKSEIAQLKKI